MASAKNSSRRSSLSTTTMALPPNTYEGRTKIGYPIRSAILRASSKDLAVPFAGCCSPSLLSIAAKSSRSSARSILSKSVPNNCTPASCSRFANFNGVCPPSCTITPMGFSSSITCMTSSKVRGSK